VTGLEVLLLKLLLGGTVFVTARLTMARIEQWLAAHRVSRGFDAVVRERLKNGNVRVIAGVFDATGTRIAAKRWTAKELDPALERSFAGRDTIRITH
jgi:hypothetical protein